MKRHEYKKTKIILPNGEESSIEIVWNDLYKTYQYYVDGALMSEPKDYNDALSDLDDEGLDKYIPIESDTLGYTESGKPVEFSQDQEVYSKGFTKQDHTDAAAIFYKLKNALIYKHGEIARNIVNKAIDYHSDRMKKYEKGGLVENNDKISKLEKQIEEYEKDRDQLKKTLANPKLDSAKKEMFEKTLNKIGQNIAFAKHEIINIKEAERKKKSSEKPGKANDIIPPKIQTIMKKYEKSEPTHASLTKMKKEMEKQGYTFDFDADLEPYDLREMKKVASAKEVSKLEKVIEDENTSPEEKERYKKILDKVEGKGVAAVLPTKEAQKEHASVPGCDELIDKFKKNKEARLKQAEKKQKDHRQSDTKLRDDADKKVTEIVNKLKKLSIKNKVSPNVKKDLMKILEAAKSHVKNT